MSTYRLNWPLWVANLLLPLAIIVFSTGFFPYKALLPGLATFRLEEANVPPAVFDRLIFMVVDALRSDFVFSDSSSFHFTQSLIRSGAALPFTAFAGSPTVTMPRLKAMTTGSVPSFLDVILNIAESDTASTLANQDTWLAQLKARGDRLVLYGDDTWLKLFPGMFERSDGTTSFFVSDFVEVDNNVTRHIPDELANDDWSAMIMHFLGLDHIGHKAGPYSPFMGPKQLEMDAIVEQIYTTMRQKTSLESTLFVLCGDHGMNDAGNHGGSSSGETSPALLLISPKFQAKGMGTESPIEASSEMQFYRTVEQSDITPTIAGLLGVPIPLNSLGVFIPELLMMWDHGFERANLLMENALQLLNTVKATFPAYSFETAKSLSNCDPDMLGGIEEVQCAWSHVPQGTLGVSGSSDIAAILRFSRAAQRLMSSTAGNFDVSRLYIGLIIAGVAVTLAGFVTYDAILDSGSAGAFLIFNMIGYLGMMFASSYVEEEQQFWYWTVTAWLAYLHLKAYSQPPKSSSSRSAMRYLASTGTICLAISLRIMRRWNQTGQKFAAEPDIARNFLPTHQILLWVVIILTYTDSCKNLWKSLPDSLMAKAAAIIVSGTAFAFKLAFVAADSPELLQDSFLFGPTKGHLHRVPLVLAARLVFCGLAVLALLSIFAQRQGNKVSKVVFHEILALLLITQTRATNIPLFLLFRLQFLVMSSMKLTDFEVTVWSLLSQYMTFFALGGSNAISSVDLSSAYNGVGQYNTGLVGILTFVSNWAGPMWWVSASHLLRPSGRHQDGQCKFAVLTLHAAVTLLAVMASCTALRTHLFIWTVFSPKFLYSMAWILGSHIGVNILGSACLASIGSK